MDGSWLVDVNPKVLLCKVTTCANEIQLSRYTDRVLSTGNIVCSSKRGLYLTVLS